ncbi:UNVERIFIED_CONTAM: hypothetical protein GTU68_015356, partial [Idotea baltica]|nr:hypothetical protein [Idotea baltica]
AIFITLVALAAARPDYSDDIVKIIRDDRVNPEAGSYSFDVETEDGIVRSESGSPLSIDGYPTGQQGSISFTFPNGEEYDLKFVANENGFQPESSWLPVAPEFPHPIPQFVLDQIAFAAKEDAEKARSAPSTRYTYGSDEN